LLLFSESQQAVPRQVDPAQHRSPGLPQAEHTPPTHDDPIVWQSRPLPTQVSLEGSQQSPAVVHVEPAQQG